MSPWSPAVLTKPPSLTSPSLNKPPLPMSPQSTGWSALYRSAPHLKLVAIEEYLPSVPTRIPSALFPMGTAMFTGSLGMGLISGALWVLSPSVPLLPIAQAGPALGCGFTSQKPLCRAGPYQSVPDSGPTPGALTPVCLLHSGGRESQPRPHTGPLPASLCCSLSGLSSALRADPAGLRVCPRFPQGFPHTVGAAVVNSR